MKNIISRIMILAMLASFAACSSELDNAGGYAGDEAMVRMNFTGLNGFAVTRAFDQTAVEKVTVYLFEGTEESSELKYTLPVTLSDKTEAGLPGSFKVPEGGTYHVEAIANANALTGISTYGDFLAQTTTAAFDGNLLMQGATAQNITLAGGQTTTLSMELVRLAATFQVVGADEADVSDVAFTLKGAVKESYLVKHADGDSFTIPADAETGENAVPYSYENPENSTVMVITGTMNGAAYRTEVPVAQVLRNHLYTVKLVNNSGTIEPELTVTDWSEISSSLEIGAGSALMMTAATDQTQESEVTVVYPEEGDLKSTQTVNVAADAAATYYLYVKSANIEAALTHTTLPDGWTLAAPAETRADYLWEKGYWTLTIPANTTAEVRTLTVIATNKLIADATVSITLVQEGKEDEAVDHSKNPLLKWAKTNLQRSGSGLSVSGDFVSDYTETGSYYQFGRNYGFNSVSEAVQNFGVERSDIASNRNIYPGTGSTTPVKTYYASTIDFSKYPNYFFIGNPSTGDGDYATPARQDTWTERAKKNGYTNESPCPEGWRLPTIAEYKEIMPILNGKSGNTGSEAWNTLVQIKTLDDGTSCAFRWSKSTGTTYSYLKIECLVIGKDVTDTSIINWNDENVVSRYFKGAGYIQSHRNLWQLTSGTIISTHYTARPMEWGRYNGMVQNNGTVYVYLTESLMNYGGFYWTSDKEQNAFSLVFNSSTGYILGYYLSIFEDAIAANIRCITDDPALQEK